MTWVLDCDGVIWLADDPIPGAADAVARLRGSGERGVFVTNNSYPARADHLAKLARMGMTTADEDLITSAGAAATLLEAGEQVLVLGGPGIVEALSNRGVEAIEPGTVRGDGEIAAVVVGFDLKFDFARLAAATTALRNGARLIASNDDATFPTSSGLLPGAGSFVAAVARAGGVEPVVAGKPFPPLVIRPDPFCKPFLDAFLFFSRGLGGLRVHHRLLVHIIIDSRRFKIERFLDKFEGGVTVRSPIGRVGGRPFRLPIGGDVP